MTEHVDSIVIGAGVIGIAAAWRLARSGRDVVVLETCDAIGTGISSRNSEVIHAGIYYPRNSLKGQLCVTGKALLYSNCESRGVEFKRLGKLIVATEEAEVAALHDILRKAETNGVNDLQWLSAARVHAMEPQLRAACALFLPSTGVVDSHGLMLALQGNAVANGAVFAFSSPVVGGRVQGRQIVLDVGGESPMEISCDQLVNAAGLHAQSVAQKLKGLARETIPPIFHAKGNYFTLGTTSHFRHLIYPIPVPGGLGRIRFSTSADKPSSAPMWNGWRAPTMRLIQAAPKASIRQFAGIGRTLPTAICTLVMPVFDPCSPDGKAANGERTSSYKERKAMAWPGWSISTAWNLPASPHRLP